MSSTALNTLPFQKLWNTNTHQTHRVPIAKSPDRGASLADRDRLNTPIPYVAHPAFRRANPERKLQRLAPLPEWNSPPEVRSEPGLTVVAGFVSLPLLTAAEEESLFAWMNYHRYRAEKLRRRWRTAISPRKTAAQIRRELERANWLRNRIVSSNLRLVVSLAKKLSRSLDQMSELIGEGVFPLIRSVELFDISLGNRFSTYATWAVRNQMLRVIRRSKTSSSGFSQSPELLLESLPARNVEPVDDPMTGSTVVQVQRLLAGLPDRERRVLRARFGLAGEPAGQSLADVARRVGLSKERVRQIVLKTLEELREQFVAQGDVA